MSWLASWPLRMRWPMALLCHLSANHCLPNTSTATENIGKEKMTFLNESPILNHTIWVQLHSRPLRKTFQLLGASNLVGIDYWGHTYCKRGKQCPARVSILENSRDFFWNFTSRSRSRVIFISLSLLDLDFQSFSFHFHFSKRVKGTKISPFFSRKKEWNFTPSFMKNLTILVSRVKNPKQIMSGIMNGDTQLFIQDTTTNNSRFRFLLPILKVLHKKIKCFWGLCPVGKSDKH